MNDSEHIVKAILAVAHELRESRMERTKSDELKKGLLAIENKIAHLEKTIMAGIQEFATAQNAFNDRIDTAVNGLQADIQTLNDLITKLQNSNGAITPEDQATLDAIQARSSTIADKLDALDALTPPQIPPTVK